MSTDSHNGQGKGARGFFGKLKDGLKRTRAGLVGGLTPLIRSHKTLDRDAIEEIEALLLGADVGIEATDRILSGLQTRFKLNKIDDENAVYSVLHDEMLQILQPMEQPLELPKDRPGTFVILMVGINGAGKTTTIGKLAQRFKGAGHTVALAAGDTFRAAAVEQLQAWGDRNDVPVTAQKAGADPASVIYDAFDSCKARGTDVLIADTAGRLHTQMNLMEELKKVHRVLGKIDPAAPHETMLVLDATTGQNALVQAQQFNEAVNVTGITLTKLDGTAKGGIVFSLAERLDLPLRYIGIGEKQEDLRKFDASDFIDALLDHDEGEAGRI